MDTKSFAGDLVGAVSGKHFSKMLLFNIPNNLEIVFQREKQYRADFDLFPVDYIALLLLLLVYTKQMKAPSFFVSFSNIICGRWNEINMNLKVSRTYLCTTHL